MMRIGMMLMIVCILSYCSCEKSGYIKGVQKDSEQIFDRKREFFKSLTFNGVISKKNLCEKCNMNKYQLVVTLEVTQSDSIELKDQYYQPYYFFDKPNQLNLSVTKDLFEAISEGEIVKKEKRSDFLSFKGQEYRVLNKKKSKWLPD